MKLIITGLARCGKDTVSEYLSIKYGLKFISSSMILLEELIYPSLRNKYGYISKEDCYEDRINHRKEWFDLISNYNLYDKSKLGRLIFEKNDIYCGLRCVSELKAIKKDVKIDKVIWVDSTDRIGITEYDDSITISDYDADIIIDNNYGLPFTYKQLDSLMRNSWQEVTK